MTPQQIYSQLEKYILNTEKGKASLQYPSFLKYKDGDFYFEWPNLSKNKEKAIEQIENIQKSKGFIGWTIEKGLPEKMIKIKQNENIS